MPRNPRVFRENSCYEYCTRAEYGIPLPSNLTSTTLISGTLARSFTAHSVQLFHGVYMGNHCHLVVSPKRPDSFHLGYGQVNKQLTDALKMLLRRPKLRVWEERAYPIFMPKFEDVLLKIVYAYSNPSKAGLCDTIDEFPGFSTWKPFLDCELKVDAEVRIPTTSVRMRDLPALPENRRLSVKEDKEFAASLHERGEPIELIIRPYAWLSFFGITKEKDIAQVREVIIRRVRWNELVARKLREKARREVIGVEKLITTKFMRNHIPKERSPFKIYLHARDKATRLYWLAKFKELFLAYAEARRRSRTVRPEGTFSPGFPPSVFAFTC